MARDTHRATGQDTALSHETPIKSLRREVELARAEINADDEITGQLIEEVRAANDTIRKLKGLKKACNEVRCPDVVPGLPTKCWQ